jgi:hypothetical protein
MSPRVVAAGRVVWAHWRTPALLVALAACLVLGFMQGENSAKNSTQDEQLAAVVVQLAEIVRVQAEERIASDVASCTSGNELRSEIREALGDVQEAVPSVGALIGPDDFPDRDCADIPGDSTPPTIDQPITEEP